MVYVNLYIYIYIYIYTGPLKAANCFKPTTESRCYVRDGTVVLSFEYD